MTISERIYRILLHAWPAGFREEYGAEMLASFRVLRRTTPAWLLWPRLMIDLAAGAPRAHLEALASDATYTLRQIRSAPHLTAVIVLTLGLGIGANTAVYSLVDAVLFRPLPVRDPSRVVTMQRGDGSGEASSWLDYADYRDRARSFEGLAAYLPLALPLSVDAGAAESLSAELVTGNYFPVLGVSAAVGRVISPEEMTGEPAIVLSHRFWTRRFGGDRAVIGRTVRIHQIALNVIGVAEEGFIGSAYPLSADMWVPASLQPRLLPAFRRAMEDRAGRWLVPIGRLREGVSVAAAQAELNVIDGQIQLANPEVRAATDRDRAERRVTLGEPRGIAVPHLRRMASAGAGANLLLTGIVLAIACINVANLLLARASARQREVAIRLALGAGRRRIVRRHVTESVILSMAGAGAGAFLAWGAHRLPGGVQSYFPGSWQAAIEPRIDLRVLAFTATLAIATGILFGLAPAVRTASVDLLSALKEGWAGASGVRRGSRLRNALVVAQLTVSMALLVATVVLVRGLQSMGTEGPGFDSANHIVAVLDLSGSDRTELQRAQLLSAVKDRIAGLPGVESASWMGTVPVSFNTQSGNLRSTELGGDVRVLYTGVDADYFRTSGIQVLAGRAFQRGDESHGGDLPVIVNELLATRLWPGRSALGETIRFHADSGPLQLEVIGVARQVRYWSLGEDPQLHLYLPYQPADLRPKLLIRTASAPPPLLPAVRTEIASAGPEIGVRTLDTLAGVLALASSPTRLAAALVGIFGALALLLAAAAVHGVMSYNVSRRIHEFGIRISVGATRADLLGLVLKDTTRLAAAGAVLGSLLGMAAAQLVGGVLVRTPPVEPVVYALVAAVLGAAAILAAAGPARRASTIAPTIALRRE